VMMPPLVQPGCQHDQWPRCPWFATWRIIRRGCETFVCTNHLHLTLIAMGGGSVTKLVPKSPRVKPPCLVCQEPSESRDLCAKHYRLGASRARRNGQKPGELTNEALAELAVTEPPRSKVDDERDQRIASMLAEGMTLAAIGASLGLTGERVRQIAAKRLAVKSSVTARRARRLVELNEIAASFGLEVLRLDRGYASCRCTACDREFIRSLDHIEKPCRCRERRYVAAGETIGHWQILEPGYSYASKVRAICSRCGNEGWPMVRNLVHGLSKSCQPCAMRMNYERRRAREGATA